MRTRPLALGLLVVAVLAPRVVVAQVPSAIVPKSGTLQTSYPGAAFPTPLVAGVYDAGGNPLPGVSVTFQAPASEPTAVIAGGGTSATVVTDANGLTPPLTATASATAGALVVTASVEGVGGVARFKLTTLMRTGGAFPNGLTAYGFGHGGTGIACGVPNSCNAANRSLTMIKGDFTGDGFTDLVAYNAGFRDLALLVGSGNLGFGGPIVSALPPHGTNDMWYFAAGDFNNDNKLDVIGPLRNQGLQIMYGTGSGAFTAGPLVPWNQPNIQASIVVGDLNHDGMVDLLSNGAVALATGPGVFSAPDPAGVPGQVLGDIDGDGHLDAVGAWSANLFAVARGRGDGTFHPVESYPFPSSVFRQPYFALGDFNGDGRPDVAASLQLVEQNFRTGQSGIAVSLNTGDPAQRFTPPQTYLHLPETTNGGIATGDLNRDGLDDIIVGVPTLNWLSGKNHEAYWWMSLGDGTFVNTARPVTFWDPNDVVIDDFDRDGRLDLAVNAEGDLSDKLSAAISINQTNGHITSTIQATGGTPQSIGVTETGTPLGVLVTDQNGAGVTWAMVTIEAPAAGPSATFTGKSRITFMTDHTGKIAWTPRANDAAGSYSVTVSTPLSIDSSASVAFALTNVAAAPAAVGDDYLTNEDTPLDVAAPGVLANDSGGGAPLTVELVSSPLLGELALNADGSFTYTPHDNAHGTDTFEYRASNGFSASAPVTVTIDITSVPDPPQAFAHSYAVDQNSGLSIAAPGLLDNVVDPDSTAFTASLVQSPAHGHLLIRPDGSFIYSPLGDFDGTDTFAFRVTDDTGLSSNVATVTVLVNDVNEAPVATADHYAAVEDTALTVAAPGVLINDIEPDDNPLVVEIVAPPAKGTIAWNGDGSFVYTPNANVNGADSFSYRAFDGELRSGEVVVTIEIAAVDDSANANADSYATQAGAPVSVAAPGVLGNDTDIEGDALSASVVSPPQHGSLTLNADGSFVYTPALNFAGSDSFSYRPQDGSPSIGVVSLTIDRAGTHTTLAVSAGEVTLGSPVTVQASISVMLPGTGEPGGSVTFMAAGMPIGSAPLSGGTASLTIATLPVGTHVLTASYPGDSAFIGSASPAMTLTVVAPPPPPPADTTPPQVNVPAPITVPATSANGAVVSFTATAMDTVDGALTPTCMPGSGSLFAIGVTTVTCEATDAAHNTGGATFTVTVTSFTTLPTSADQCKDGGWQGFGSFKNQGACVSFVNKGKKG